eukprot:scaffold22603_cov116-Cylindrotheca_fusiformis.AAC.3
MSTIRLYYGRDNDEMIRRLKEARNGKVNVANLEVRETVLDEDVIKEIVDLVISSSIETVHLDDCGAYLNEQAVRMAQALGSVKNVRLSEPTFLSQFFLDKLLISATTLANLRIQGHLHFEQITALSQGLEANQSLLTLDLSRSRLENFSLLSEGLQRNESLQILKLRSIGLRDTHVNNLLRSIEGHKSLISLDLSFNHCQHMDHIAEFISKDSSIRDLQLGYQNVWQSPKVSISSLAGALRDNRTLKSLSLARNKLQDEDAYLIANTIDENLCLENLNLSENKITDHGIVSIAQSLGNNPTQRELSLQKNPFGTVGYEAILNAVKTNHSLFQINLVDYGFITTQIQYETALNRGGRKLIFDNPPLSLWPLALERINTLDLVPDCSSRCDIPKYSLRPDVMLYLLKGPALFEGIICGEASRTQLAIED